MLTALQSIRTDPLWLTLARDEHVDAAESDLFLLERCASLVAAGPIADQDRPAFELEFPDTVEATRDAAVLFEELLTGGAGATGGPGDR